MDKEMLKALRADGEKLRQLTGQDHGPFELRIMPCEACGGDGGFERPVSHDPFRDTIRYAFDECTACGGTGELEIEVVPVDLEDLA